MSRLPIHTIESAPAEARERLRGARRASGFLPNLLGVLANAPTALETYQTVTGINTRSSLDATEREIVQITAAVHNDCGFCVAGHTRLAYRSLALPETLVDALRAAQPLDDPRHEALARFTRQVLDHRGRVPDPALAEFQAAGYTPAHALDVVLGVSLATLCNYANNLAQTPLNAELQAYA